MPAQDFVRLMADDPLAAGELLKSIGHLLSATGNRISRKADDLHRMARTRPQRRRAMRVRRRALQRLELAALALKHAQDLFHRAAGNDDLCSADPLRRPLSLETTK